MPLRQLMVLSLVLSLAVSAATPTGIAVTVAEAPRQAFAGFGFSHGRELPQFGGLMFNFTEAVREQIFTLVCEDLGTNAVRLWWTPEDGAAPPVGHPGWAGLGSAAFLESYVDSGLVAAYRRHGVTRMLLAPDSPCAVDYQNASSGGHNVTLRAEKTVEFITQLHRSHNVTIDVTGVANEPGCWERWTTPDGASHHANWPTVPDTSGNVVTAVSILAQGLARANIRVGIIAPESSNADDGPGLAEVEGCKHNPECWSVLTAIASHSCKLNINHHFSIANRHFSIESHHSIFEPSTQAHRQSPSPPLDFRGHLSDRSLIIRWDGGYRGVGQRNCLR